MVISASPNTATHSAKDNANKAAMIAAIEAHGFHPADDNEADAIALLLWATAPTGGRV